MKKRLVAAIGMAAGVAIVWSGISGAEALKIGYVDFVEFATKSKKAQEVQKQFAELVAAKRDALDKKGNDLIAKRDEIAKQRGMLKEEVLNQKIKELSIKEMELKMEQEEAEKALRNQQQDIQAAFQRDAVKIIGEIRRQKGLNIVINGQALLSADDALNITDEVVKAYDGHIATGTGPKPGPGPEPAAPKPAKPAQPAGKGPK